MSFNPLIHGKRTDNGYATPIACDANGNLLALLSGTQESDGSVGSIKMTDDGYLRNQAAITAQASVLLRSNVSVADVMAAPGTVTTSVVAGGSCTAGTYKVNVVAVNVLGRTTATAGSTATTSAGNLTVRVAFAAVTGATAYDIYVSTDTDPKWVGRITEAQRASGILINAVGGTSAGGTAGAADVQVIGTGQQAGTTAAQNTAYTLAIGSLTFGAVLGQQYQDFDVVFKPTGDAASPALVVLPAYYNNGALNNWSLGAAQTLSYGGTTGAYGALTQTVRVESRGRYAVLLVAKITGGAVDIYQTAS